MYKWKLKGLSKKVDPELAVQELDKIQNIHGKLTPELIVQTAEQPDNVLHNLFTWDNDEAADKWRLHQARLLINNIELTIIKNGETRTIDVYEITSKSDGYKHISTFDKSDVEYVRETILKDLQRVQEKLKLYSEFSKVRSLIVKAIGELC